MTMARAPRALAAAISALMAARSRPSRVPDGSPASSSAMVAGAPRTLPSGAMTATARWPWLTSMATTGCSRRSSSDAAGAGAARGGPPAKRAHVRYQPPNQGNR